MTITAAIVLYSVLWFLTFLVVIPIRLETQDDAGEIVPGTHAGAPERHHLKRKAVITTIVAAILWAVIAGIILSGWIGIRDIDFFNRMSPPAAAGETGG